MRVILAFAGSGYDMIGGNGHLYFEIAKAYRCNYAKEPADKYLCFMAMTKEIADNLADEVPVGPETLLKLIDEYNYSRHTQGWISA